LITGGPGGEAGLTRHPSTTPVKGVHVRYSTKGQGRPGSITAHIPQRSTELDRALAELERRKMVTLAGWKQGGTIAITRAAYAELVRRGLVGRRS
jgi:hypothetical protein